MYYSITQLAHAALALGTTIHEVFELETTNLYRSFEIQNKILFYFISKSNKKIDRLKIVNRNWIVVAIIQLPRCS